MNDVPRRSKVIICILPAGNGIHVLQQLRKIGVDSAFVHHARGLGESGKRRRGAGFYTEREIVTALVELARADEIFEFLYHEAGIGKPHAGMLLMERAPRAIPLKLPDLPEES